MRQPITSWFATVAVLTALGGSAVAAQIVLAPAADAPEAEDDARRRYEVMVLPFGEDRAYLGVQIEEDADHPDGGARVTSVVPDGPADRAGVREDDVIVRFGGDVIRGPARLTRLIHEHDPGDAIAIEVRRGAQSLTVDVELGDRSESWARRLEPLGNMVIPLPDPPDIPDVPELHFEPSEAPFGGAYTLFDCGEGDCPDVRFLAGLGRRAVLGVELTETTPELRRHLGGDADAGVLIGKVLSGTPAEQAGVAVGDLILRVDGDPVANARDLRSALQNRVGTTFDLEIVRDRAPLTLQVTIPEPTRDRPTGPRAALRPPRPAPPAPASPPTPARPATVAPTPPTLAPIPAIRPPAPPAPVAAPANAIRQTIVER